MVLSKCACRSPEARTHHRSDVSCAEVNSVRDPNKQPDPGSDGLWGDILYVSKSAAMFCVQMKIVLLFLHYYSNMLNKTQYRTPGYSSCSAYLCKNPTAVQDTISLIVIFLICYTQKKLMLVPQVGIFSNFLIFRLHMTASISQEILSSAFSLKYRLLTSSISSRLWLAKVKGASYLTVQWQESFGMTLCWPL